MPEPTDRPPIERVAGTVVGWASLVSVLVLVLWAGRDLWFFSDDWNILADYHDGGLLEPFNGHLSLVPAGLYRICFAWFGTGSYLPYRLVGVAGLAVLGYQVLRYATERLAWSRRDTWLAALALSAVVWNPSGATNLMFPFLVNFSLPIAALVAIWRRLDRDAVRDDVAASLWLAVALGSSGLGVMALGAVLVELVVGRAPWRRWAVLAPAPLLWVGWFVTRAGSNEWSTDPAAVLSYSARMVLGATTSLAAGWRPGGFVVAAALVGVVGAAALRWRSLDARALGALAAPVGFVLSTALTRLEIVPAIPPDELRYSWTVAAYLVLFAVTVWRADAWSSSRVWTARAAAALATVAVLVGAVRLVGEVRGWSDMVSSARPRLEAVLVATELLGADALGPGRVLPLSYVPVTVEGYLDAVAAVGSPVEGMAARVVAEGRAADELFAAAVRSTPVGSDAAARCSAAAAELEAVPPGSSVVVATQQGVVPGDGLPGLLLARVGAEPVPVELPAGDVVRVELPPDREPARGAATAYRLSAGPGRVVSACP